MSLKNKRVLITAGPTWIPLDRIRVISNRATGRTGILLAERLQDSAAWVTLLLGPVESCGIDKRIRLIRFHFFNELKNKLTKELRSRRYDIVIHSAAVSDYKPLKKYAYKVESGIQNWRVILVPTEKIINSIKKISSSLFLVGFKFEPEADKGLLLEKARSLINRANLDLAVANSIYKNHYLAYIINNNNKIYGPLKSRVYLVSRLVNLLKEIF